MPGLATRWLLLTNRGRAHHCLVPLMEGGGTSYPSSPKGDSSPSGLIPALLCPSWLLLLGLLGSFPE